MPLPSCSIITPALNALATLPTALESVRSQDGVAVEHIVVDGGSHDGTVGLLERTAGVRWISEPDRGLADAVNKGIRMASGDLIGWLNADDLYRPGALMAVAQAFGEGEPAMWGFGRCGIIGADDREIRGPVTAYKNMLLRRYSFALHLTQNFVSAPATFVRREAFAQVGLFDEQFEYSMDYDLWLRLGRRWKPLFIDAELAAFRMVEGTLSMTGFERQFAEHERNARVHGSGHRLPVAANVLMSRTIPLVYRGMRFLRTRRGGAAN